MAINGKGRPTKEQASQAKLVKDWLDHIASYEREFRTWETRVDKIIKRYRDDERTERDGSAKFNILWANVQTLTPATYSKVPQPDVSRRFKDNDPVGRVAGLMLERALDFEVQHYEDYRGTMKACVLDRFLGGRGTAWARYEPHIRAISGTPEDGSQVTENADEPDEELDYECAPVDYVHWKDFGHTRARTWDEVRGVWRRVYMTKKALEDRFGAEKAKTIPCDSKPEDSARIEMGGDGENLNRALIYEIWDKEEGKAYWLSKTRKEIIDEKDDPLGLEDFFPCPKPLFSSVTNESLVPIPDFTLYQDQARQLDTLADRLDGLIQALQVKGVYDASIPEIGRIFTEGMNGTLIPVKNWAAFAEKNGLEGAIDIVDLKNIYEALGACYEAIQQCLKIIYDITGLADIVRGQSEAQETATAQQIKGQYASLRLNSMKQEVAMLATHLFQLKAQIMCGKFAPETLMRIGGVEQLSDEDKALVPQAMTLLLGPRATNPDATEQPNPLRIFRIEVNSDTMVQIDENTEKQQRMEFLQANGAFMDKAMMMMSQAGAAAPAIAPVIMALWKFGVTGFKVGKLVEGTIDAAADQLKAMMANPPPPPPDPEMLKIQANQQSEGARLEHDKQVAMQQHQQAAQDAALQHQREMEKMAAQTRDAQAQAAIQAQQEAEKMASQERIAASKAARDQDTELRKTALQVAGQIEVAKINAAVKATADAATAANDAEKVKVEADKVAGEKEVAVKQEKRATDEGADARKIMETLLGHHEELLKTITADQEIVRDESGKMAGLRRVK